MVIWVTGISGASKTTLCQPLWNRFEPKVREMVLLDGDAVRSLYETPLAYEEADRVRQIQAIQCLVKMLNDQGKVVLVAA